MSQGGDGVPTIVVYCAEGHDTVVIERFQQHDGQWRGRGTPAILDPQDARPTPQGDEAMADRFAVLLGDLAGDATLGQQEWVSSVPVRERWQHLRCGRCGHPVPARDEKLQRALDMVLNVGHARRLSLRALQGVLSRS